MACSRHSMSRPHSPNLERIGQYARLGGAAAAEKGNCENKEIIMGRLGLFFAALAVLPLEETAAQSYPDKPIKLIVPFVPGSPVDVLARVVSQQLGLRLGQAVIIENRPGAGTSTGTKMVATSPADGYTLLMSGQSLTYLNLFYPDL